MLRYFHDMGVVQFFDHDFLRDKVVISPQWIVDAMAGLVSVKDVKNSPIKVIMSSLMRLVS